MRTRVMWRVAVCGAIVLLSTAGLCQAADDDRKQVASLIQKLYSYSTSTFEFSTFGGKYQPRKGCLLVKEFFAEGLIRQVDGTCRVIPAAAGIRYPALSAEDLSPATWMAPPPKPIVKEIWVDKTSATVKVNFVNAPGRVVFFLDKKEGGWRIANALMYENWPLNVPAEGCSQVAGYSILVPPRSRRELEDLPTACRPQLEDRMVHAGKS